MKIANFKSQIGLRVSLCRTPKVKVFHFSFFILPFALLVISGCVGFQTAGEVQTGRYELMLGKAESALPHFQRAAELDPTYIMRFGVFQEGVWSYVGRAYYDMGKLPEARQALERALSRYDQDHLAKLYLGLTLARDGDKRRGLSEMESGLKGLYDWLEWITYHTSYGIYWDPRREIRNEIKTNLATISGKEIDYQKLIDGGESIGKKMEEEIDLARRDEIEAYKQGEGKGEP